MKSGWTVHAAAWFVRGEWRSAILRDLEEEAATAGRGDWWMAAAMIAVGLRMRLSFNTDAAFVDVRDVLRSLVREKGFTAAAVFTLVLGIGLNLAVFTVVDRVLFRPLPFAAIDHLVMLSQYNFERQARAASFAKRLFVEGRRLPAVVDMAYGGFTAAHTVSHDGAASPALGLTEVSFNFLEVLGTQPVFGRSFIRADADTAAAAIITYETWRDRFHGDPAVLGAELRAGNRVRVIVGVLPPGFQPPVINRPRASFDGLFVGPDTLENANSRDTVWAAVARLAPGASVMTSQQQFDILSSRLQPELGDAGHRVLVEPLRPAMFWYGYRYLWLLAAAAALVGVAACVNLSSLLLARGRSRAQETAVRASLGATLQRLLLAEFARSLVICALAAAVSVVVLFWLHASLRGLVPGYFRLLMLRDLDGRVFAFAVLVVVFASVLAGALPAWRATRTSLMAVMQRDGGLPGQARRQRAGQAVITLQAAAGVVLVLAATMVIRDYAGLVRTDAGFAPVNLQVVRVQPTGERRGGNDVAELARYRGVLEILRQQPTVVSAGAIDSMPASGAAPMTGFRVTPGGFFGLWQVTDGLLETLGTRLVAGRFFTTADLDTRAPVAVVSASAARRLWPDVPTEGVIGREIVAAGQPTRRVVGVAADLRERPDKPAEPMVFAPVRPEGMWFMDFAVRTKGGHEGLNTEVLRRALASPFGVTSVTADPAGGTIQSALEQPRIQAVMFGTFGVSALLLVALGLYAVTSFDVALRQYELGIRSALGASRSAIRRVVILDAIRPVIAGSTIGIVGSYWLSRWVQALVYRVEAHDPWNFVVVLLILVIAAVLATWLPARRASMIDPAAVLRE